MIVFPLVWLAVLFGCATWKDELDEMGAVEFFGIVLTVSLIAYFVFVGRFILGR